MGRRVDNSEIIKRLNNISDFSEYNILEETIIGSSKKAKFIHINCPENGNENFEFSMIIKDFIRGQRCPACAAKRRILSNTKNHNDKNISKSLRKCKPLDEYIKRISEYDDYTYDSIYDNEYIGTHTKVNIRHKCCDRLFVKRISDFLYNDQHCPICYGKGGHKNTNIETIKRINAAGFELVDYDENIHLYTHSKHNMRCLKCGAIQERNLNTIINLSGKCICQVKKLSNGEMFIREYLNESNIEFLSGKTFDGLEYRSTLRCDFFLPSYNTVIEYDGLQHFLENDKIFFHDSLKEIQERDITKNKFCIENNIEIIRISYKENNKKKIANILNEFLNLATINKIDGKPYDGKLSRTVWVGGKSDYDEYIKYNSK